MNIGIIGAMSEEVEFLLRDMELETSEVKANMKFSVGTIHNKNVVIVTSGIGKVNAAVCAQILIDDFKVDYVINVGIAGGTKKNIYPGDVVIANNLVQHDIDTSAFGDRIGQIPRLDTFDFKCDKKLIDHAIEACKDISGHNYFVGRIVSGDQFIANIDKIKWLNSEFECLACEMEGASIAQVCYLNQIPFVVIRSISDNANNGAHMEYEKFKDIAVENSTKILNNMLKLI
ncbi:5'-methylthioadenosine/adenosylhomocysteine nucleosidase [Clostridium tagluense]|uniref:5'-methylthioadenosine/adenosylhomocysteine nucleosidase n=1 Tax=Clostridium tagluense TaxID=360422 RepID=UPI001CF4B237|nr:5'-methylthioadenosine/adenosylhomocysteine nucleosidase [Clostridium tagluense]MCB2309968.1 5'-methylthioadenosine/adenosylhomocysteine nucleosidase [Clostridium tagluense]MCB2314502.1 5'-methylthioadenosine/adenosylhomocysteine nucleosidase [Clostridium tagluense]MCB2319350.1 5'-methylthioadenosine/adenosylhomocysteine nucleosidase [Clostridium tagluense]MCB2324562.1 5'-methylthioadenosine/adenosylhomocysteine nucleosidase [Clostridium tagluense]MCB2329413.1 5'-methylthioadenosine/adenosy